MSVVFAVYTKKPENATVDKIYDYMDSIPEVAILAGSGEEVMQVTFYHGSHTTQLFVIDTQKIHNPFFQVVFTDDYAPAFDDPANPSLLESTVFTDLIAEVGSFWSGFIGQSQIIDYYPTPKGDLVFKVECALDLLIEKVKDMRQKTGHQSLH